MKKRIIAVTVAAFLFSCCATARDESAVFLGEAIELAAERIFGDLPAGSRVAVVAFEAESDGLLYFVMDELIGALVDRGVWVMTRQAAELELLCGRSISA